MIVRAHTILETRRLPATAVTSPVDTYLAGLAKGSRRTMRQALDRIAGLASDGALDADTLPWHLLRPQDTSAIRGQLVDRFAPATAGKMLSALRGVLREAWRIGSMDTDTYRRAVDVRGVHGSREIRGRALSEQEVVQLAGACGDGTALGLRDGAMVALLVGAGLRRAEVVDLDLAMFDSEAGQLNVIGKGDRQRVVPLARGVGQTLGRWIKRRGHEAGPLVVPVRRGGHIELRRLTTQAIWAAVKRRAGQAGLPHTTPHDLRRTFATDLLDKGADVFATQALLGHQSVETTRRYDRRGDRAMRAAVARLQLEI